MDEPTLKIITRDSSALDAGFIFSSWINSIYFAENPHSNLDKAPRNFHYLTERRIRKIMDASHVTVACVEDNQSQIMGYAVISDKVEWVYIKKDYRGNGIAKLLTKGYKCQLQKKE